MADTKTLAINFDSLKLSKPQRIFDITVAVNGIAVIVWLLYIVNDESFIGLRGWLPLAVAIGLIIVINLAIRNIFSSDRSVQNFANENGYDSSLKWLDMPVRSYMNRRLMRSGQMNIISGSLHGVEFQSYDVISSGVSDEYRVVTALELKVDMELPQIFISSTHNDGDFPNWTGEDYQQIQNLDVGGSFNRNFNIYVPKEYEIEGLDIADPALLDIIDLYSLRMDVEFIRDRVIIYLPTRTIRHTKERYQEIFTLAQKLAKHLSHKQRTWRFVEIPKTPTNLKESFELSDKATNLIALAMAYSIKILLLAFLLLIVGGFVYAVNDIFSTFST